VFEFGLRRIAVCASGRRRTCRRSRAARHVGINNLRTGCDGIERIGTVEAFGVTQGTAVNSFHRRDAEMQKCRNAGNSFNAEDAEGRRDAEDCSCEKSPSHNGPGFFMVPTLGRPHEASRAAVPKKNAARGGPTDLGVPFSASLPLCVLCVKAVGSFLNWCLTPILLVV
jgi:hypothetical protein